MPPRTNAKKAKARAKAKAKAKAKVQAEADENKPSFDVDESVAAAFLGRADRAVARFSFRPSVEEPRTLRTAPTRADAMQTTPIEDVSPSERGTSLRDLSEEVLAKIAGSLAPPDVFSFATCSKELFSVFSRSPVEGSRPLAAELLQSSLKRELQASLNAVTSRKEERPSFTLEDIFPEEGSFRKDAPPQVLLSGSLAVQAALGRSGDDEEWKLADVDIFCTWDAAPFVRQRLFEKCRLICSGVDNGYRQSERDLAGARDESSLETSVHHVESYASRPISGTYGWRDDLPYTSDEYYAQTLEWGELVLEDAGMPRFGISSSESYGGMKVGVPGGSAGGVFAYDHELRYHHSFVQLVVGKRGVKDARELLESFDMEICKCYYDGREFHVPAPGDTFAGRSAITHARRDLVADFMGESEPLPGDLLVERQTRMVEFERLLPVMTRIRDQSWAGVGLGPCTELDTLDTLSDWLDTLSSQVVGQIGKRLHTLNEQHAIESRYRFIVRLISRMQKYHRRGVTLIDPPRGALEWLVRWPVIER